MMNPGIGQGPPVNTGKGTPSALAGRFTTNPNAPSSLCFKSNTTVWEKCLSLRTCLATRKDPASDDMRYSSEGLQPQSSKVRSAFTGAWIGSGVREGRTHPTFYTQVIDAEKG